MPTLSLYPDDTFITSYPKSGNTWVRFFVANLLRGDDSTDFTNLDQCVPDLAKIDVSALALLPRPRFIKSHDPFTPQFPRVLYLVRDVRAVVTSYYRQRLRMGVIPPETPIADFVRMFLDGSVAQFGPWDAHVAGWVNGRAANTPANPFLLVRYEDMMSKSPETFRAIAAFLRLDSGEAAVEKALALTSFERMRKLEEQAGRAWPEKKNAKDLSIPFMYSGQTDSWRRDLDEGSRRLLEARFGGLLSRLGYDV